MKKAEKGKNSNNAIFCEVSVKTRLGINELLGSISKKICRERSCNVHQYYILILTSMATKTPKVLLICKYLIHFIVF
jgi:hypothetical protein